MKTLSKNITVTCNYDYIRYDGSNAEEVFNFAKRHNILCKAENEPFVMRPEDIPNLNETELLEWWVSTGEMKPISKYNPGILHNTHNINNMPTWRKDEDFYLVCKTGMEGYCRYEYFRKDMGIVTFGKNYSIMYFNDEEDDDDKVRDYINHEINEMFE